EGEPLPEEKGLPHNRMIDSGVMLITKHLGFPDALFADPKSQVRIVELQFRLNSKNLDLSHNPSHKKPSQKSWWKFW
ncbi:MAG: hypothetical protein ACRC2T_17580, partial [Thermoguttaceae bacterium]